MVDPLSPQSAVMPSAAMSWPTEIVHITSDFGWRIDPVSGRGTRLHAGVDFRGAIGDPVLAVAQGTVAFAGHDDLLGNHVIIDHATVDHATVDHATVDHATVDTSPAVQSFYGHLSDVLVVPGVKIQRGAAIGLVGNTGRSAAPHLHLTIKVDGVAVDPLALIGHPVHSATALAARIEPTPAPPPPTPTTVAADPVAASDDAPAGSAG